MEACRLTAGFRLVFVKKIQSINISDAAAVVENRRGSIDRAKQNRAATDRTNGPNIDRTDAVFADYSSGERLALLPDADIEGKNIKSGTDALHRMIEQAKIAEDPESITEKNAMYRSEIGQIDFVWGKPGNGPKLKKGYGISHIIAKHGEQTAKKVVEVIAKGTEFDKQGNNQTAASEYRLRIYYDGYTAVLNKSSNTNHWLLTAWEKETAEYAAGEGNDSTGATAATPTLTRRNGVDTAVSDVRLSESDKNVKQSFSVEDEVEELDEGYRRSAERDAAEDEPTGKNGSVLPQRQSTEPDYENISFEIMEQRAKDASLQQLRQMAKSAEGRLNRYRRAKRSFNRMSVANS